MVVFQDCQHKHSKSKDNKYKIVNKNIVCIVSYNKGTDINLTVIAVNLQSEIPLFKEAYKQGKKQKQNKAELTLPLSLYVKIADDCNSCYKLYFMEQILVVKFGQYTFLCIHDCTEHQLSRRPLYPTESDRQKSLRTCNCHYKDL